MLSRIKCQPTTQNLKVNAKHEKMRKTYIWKSSPQKQELIPEEYKLFVEMDAIKR